MMIMQTGFNTADLSGTSSVKETVKAVDGGTSKFESVMSQTSGYKSEPASGAQKTVRKMFAGRGDTGSTDNVNTGIETSDKGSDINVYEETAVELVKQIVRIIQDATGCTEEQAVQFVAGVEEPSGVFIDGSGIKEIVMMANDITEPSELIVNKDACSQMQQLGNEIKNLISAFSDGKELTSDEQATIEAAVSDIVLAADQAQENVDDILPFVQGEKNETDVTNILSEITENTDYDNLQAKTDDIITNETADSQTGQNETVSVEESVDENVSATAVNAQSAKTVQNDEIVGQTGKNDDAFYVNDSLKTDEQDAGSNLKDSGQSLMDSKEKHAETGEKTGHVSQIKERTVTSNGVVNNLFQTIKETVSTVVAGETQQTSFATRILNQVLDGIKVMRSENMSSMEMQLNPESLGKLSIQVISKNGVVTAQIAAQSEAVKEAVESQIAVLRQNMEEHGIKIEDVEVTVASHGFEQEMNNGNDGGQERQQHHRHADSSHSTVNADIKAVKEEVAEEIIKEQKGSTVSYSA